MTHVWYAAYGSNLAADRFACYLRGGRPAGSSRTNPGARDRTPPRDDVAVHLPGTTYFAGESGQWGGGTAFYDHATPGRTAARAYLLSIGQLVDVAEQEMHRDPVPDHPLETLLLEPLADGRHEAGPGVYETLVVVGERDGLAMLTLTAPHTATQVTHTRPSADYLATMTRGLAESHGWDGPRAAAYLSSLQNLF